MSETTLQNPVEQIVAELRTIRRFMLRLTGILDTEGASEAVHYLRTSLTSVDDAIDRLERPDEVCTCATTDHWRMTSDRGRIDPDCPVHGLVDVPGVPSRVAPAAPRTPLELDRLMDLQMDVDHSDPDA